jgi:hypothetical protein
MRKALGLCLSVMLLGAVMAAAQQKGRDSAQTPDVLGLWTGTWEGAGSTGGFELTLAKSDEGKIGGGVSVTGEPTYKAALRTVTFDGLKMTAVYDFTPDPQMEVVLTATFEGSTANGAWTARQKSGADVASGTWTVKRKQP